MIQQWDVQNTCVQIVRIQKKVNTNMAELGNEPAWVEELKEIDMTQAQKEDAC